MSQLVIEIDTPEDEALLMRLLPKLNGRVVAKNDSVDLDVKRKTLKDVFSKLSQNEAIDKYGDP